MPERLKLFAISHEDQYYVDFIQKHPELDQWEDEKVLEVMVNDWLEKESEPEVRFVMGPISTGTRLFLYLWYKQK